MSAVKLNKLLEIIWDNPELYGWLRGGVSEWASGECSLDKALDLTGGGAAQAKNDTLRKISMLIDPNYKQSNWARSGAVAEAIKRFESGKWSRLQRGGNPSISTDLDRALLDLFQICSFPGVPMTISQRKIHDVLANSDRNSETGQAVSDLLNTEKA